MKTAGIICEFDPFHNGHARLIKEIRERGFDSVVCVMSGDFVQRGGPAMWDKFARARAAVSCGADLVLELPAVYAVNSADWFARGGVRVLKGLGCVDAIAFGSECGDAEKLARAAKQMLDEGDAFGEAIKSFLGQGESYPSAYQKAAELVFQGFDSSLLGSPNDVLALCYLRENARQKAGLQPVAVKRFGPAHGSDTAESGFASASLIRDLILGGSGEWNSFVPSEALTVLGPLTESPDKLTFRSERFFALVRKQILDSSEEELSKICEVSEGLENRLKDASERAKDLNELVLGVKASRYTYARVMRVLTQLILGIDKDLLRETDGSGYAYARVLALGGRGSEVLKSAKEKGSIPVYSNINKNVPADAPELKTLGVDISSGDTYSIICGRAIAEYSDRVQIPNML